MKTIVISAVNIRRGGTLTILRDCLSHLSSVAEANGWRIVAIVHRRDLCEYPHIEYIELPHVATSWFKRLWCEYQTMHTISKQLAPIDLWFSLHDTTPRVEAARQAVYCQTSFPFLRWRFRDLRFDPKIVIFALFTRFAYLINIRRNRFLVVQTEWLRKGFSAMFSLPEERFIVAPPERGVSGKRAFCESGAVREFCYAAIADCHKNFELLCEAATLLEREIGPERFRVTVTLGGGENRYAKWIYERWGGVRSINFAGYMTREQLYACYEKSDCLVFPSRVETWGLPISEFAAYGKPMLLADLPYAHETAAGHPMAAFFNPNDAAELKEKMKALVEGRHEQLAPVPTVKIEEPIARDWQTLFDQLLN